ncbi:MAG: hypothetical protein ABSH51_10120 [Solirubrobacteraceae bacterium]|jgi:hypothetical protein
MTIIKRVTAAALAALGIAACGSGAATGSGTGGAPAPGTLGQAAFKFAACMRSHGVASFPDPVITHQAGNTQVAIRAPAGAEAGPGFKTAQQACGGILPNPQQIQGAQSSALLAHEHGLLRFSRCMRGHGVSRFPDPTSQGQLTVAMITADGIDIHAPNVLQAVKVCLPASGGAITPADVQRAENGQT